MLSADNGAINTLPTVYICESGCLLVNGIEPFSLKWQVLGIFDTILEGWGIQPHLLGFFFFLIDLPSLNFRKYIYFYSIVLF